MGLPKYGNAHILHARSQRKGIAALLTITTWLSNVSVLTLMLWDSCFY